VTRSATRPIETQGQVHEEAGPLRRTRTCLTSADVGNLGRGPLCVGQFRGHGNPTGSFDCLPSQLDAHPDHDNRHAERARRPALANQGMSYCVRPARRVKPASTTSDDQMSVAKCSASASRAWLRAFWPLA